MMICSTDLGTSRGEPETARPRLSHTSSVGVLLRKGGIAHPKTRDPHTIEDYQESNQPPRERAGRFDLRGDKGRYGIITSRGQNPAIRR